MNDHEKREKHFSEIKKNEYTRRYIIGKFNHFHVFLSYCSKVKRLRVCLQVSQKIHIKIHDTGFDEQDYSYPVENFRNKCLGIVYYIFVTEDGCHEGTENHREKVREKRTGLF